MTRDLLLFTANHPFTHNGGETMFVAPELPWLCRRFDRVLVVPLYDGGRQLDLPLGAEVDRGLARRWRRFAPWYLLAALAWPGMLGELVKALRQGGLLGAARAWRWAGVASATWAWLRARPAGAQPLLLYSYWRGGQTLAALRWAEGRAGARVVTRVHRYELYEDAFDPPFQPWTRIYRQVDLTMTIARHGLEHLVARGVPRERLSLARLGVAAARSRAQASADSVWRVVSCSNVIALKRVDLVAQALMALARRHESQAIEWIHFGDGPALASVQALLADAPGNLQAHLKGAVPNSAVLEHYVTQPVDVLVLLSSSEGLPVSIQEALAHGITVLATDVGGVAEAVDRSGDNGRLLPPDPSSGDVVIALEELLLADAPQRTRQRDAAWQRWAEDFDAERNHAATANRLAEL